MTDGYSTGKQAAALASRIVQPQQADQDDGRQGVLGEDTDAE